MDEFLAAIEICNSFMVVVEAEPGLFMTVKISKTSMLTLAHQFSDRKGEYGPAPKWKIERGFKKTLIVGEYDKL